MEKHAPEKRFSGFAIYFSGRITKYALGRLLDVSHTNINDFTKSKTVWKECNRLGLTKMFDTYVTEEMKAELEKLGYVRKPWSNWNV